MNILTGTEGVQQVFVLTHVRQQTQLYLAVVGAEKQTTLIGNDRLADQLTALRTDGQVLQVRVTARQASCGGDRLVVGRVYLAVLGDETRKRGDVGRDEFVQRAVVQNQSDYLVAFLQRH